MQELHHLTVEKIEYLKQKGYNVVEIWECDVNREMKYYFDHYHIADPLDPRHALYGDRTNAAKLYHRCQGNEKIRYVDFTSLYPYHRAVCSIPFSRTMLIALRRTCDKPRAPIPMPNEPYKGCGAVSS